MPLTGSLFVYGLLFQPQVLSNTVLQVLQDHCGCNLKALRVVHCLSGWKCFPAWHAGSSLL